jgi:integrase-like protein
VKKGFHTTCRIAGIEGLIWKDLRATFGTRLAEAGCDAFTIAQLLGHSAVRMTMRYVRSVETSKRVAVEAVRFKFRKSWSRFGQLAKTASDDAGCKSLKLNGGAEGGRTPDLRIANGPNGPLHLFTCSNMRRHNLQFFNRLQPLQDQFLVQSLTSIFIDLQRVE